MKTLPRPISLLLIPVAVAAMLVACSKSGGPSANVDVPAKTAELKSPDASVRIQAATDLAAAGPKAAPAMSALIEALKDSDPLVRRLSAYALGQIGPEAKAAIPALKEALSDSSTDVIPAALNAIRAIDSSALPPGGISNVQTPRGGR